MTIKLLKWRHRKSTCLLEPPGFSHGEAQLLSTKSNIRLCNAIDELNKVISKKSVLTKTRIAYNLQFELKTVLKIGNELSSSGVEVKDFVELLSKLEFDDRLSLKRTNYHVIIDDENLNDKNIANRAVAKFFQQTIFLNINLDIQKKSEIKMSIMKDRFRRNYAALVSEIFKQQDHLQTALERAELNESGNARVKELGNALKKTAALLVEANARPLRIAALGMKKADKSVVINNLLRRDFAPTSSE